MAKVKIGDVFSIKTSRGKVFFQYTNSERGKEYIKIFDGFYEKDFNKYEELIKSKIRFMISFSVKLAYKHQLINYEYHLPLLKEEVPEYTRTPWTFTGKFEGWLIENTMTKNRRLTQELTSEEICYSPSGWINYEYLLNMLENDFKLENWTTEYIMSQRVL